MDGNSAKRKSADHLHDPSACESELAIAGVLRTGPEREAYRVANERVVRGTRGNDNFRWIGILYFEATHSSFLQSRSPRDQLGHNSARGCIASPYLKP
jgi:hypothetical protein